MGKVYKSFYYFTFLLGLFLLFLKIEEVIIARGDLESIDSIKKIRPLRTGLVNEVLIKEGQSVKEEMF